MPEGGSGAWILGGVLLIMSWNCWNTSSGFKKSTSLKIDYRALLPGQPDNIYITRCSAPFTKQVVKQYLFALVREILVSFFLKISSWTLKDNVKKTTKYAHSRPRLLLWYLHYMVTYGLQNYVFFSSVSRSIQMSLPAVPFVVALLTVD